MRFQLPLCRHLELSLITFPNIQQYRACDELLAPTLHSVHRDFSLQRIRPGVGLSPFWRYEVLHASVSSGVAKVVPGVKIHSSTEALALGFAKPI